MSAQIDIDAMPAGRELDEQIARQIFNWQDVKRAEAPYYSTNIAAAWQVVERMKPLGVWLVDLQDYYKAAFLNSDDDVVGGEASAETAPLAICCAALKAQVVQLS